MNADKAPPKNKGGRPPKYAGEGKRITHTMRFREQTRQKLIEAAQQSSRSVSEEIEHRVDKSFSGMDDAVAMFGGVDIFHLCLTMAGAMKMVELTSKQSITSDAKTAAMARAAVDAVFDLLKINQTAAAPKPSVGSLSALSESFTAEKFFGKMAGAHAVMLAKPGKFSDEAIAENFNLVARAAQGAGLLGEDDAQASSDDGASVGSDEPNSTRPTGFAT